jgi:hypothetical protein
LPASLLNSDLIHARNTHLETALFLAWRPRFVGGRLMSAGDTALSLDDESEVRLTHCRSSLPSLRSSYPCLAASCLPRDRSSLALECTCRLV